MALAFVVFILLFRVVNSTSVIDAIYILCSYTYGPLLGLFAFALFTRRQANGVWVPTVTIAAPLLCFGLDSMTQRLADYRFGYELLLLNGLLTFGGLLLASRRGSR